MYTGMKKWLAATLATLLLITSLTAAIGETPEAEVSPIPELVQASIDVAEKEWTDFYGKSIKRSNKYTKWYCGKECEFGWCGGFLVWCQWKAGISMQWSDQLKAVDPSDVTAIKEAGVGKLLTAYKKLDRLTNIPKPGYPVIYAVANNHNKTVHVGLVTEVEDRGDGMYGITTIEGNLSSQVKKFKYLYDSSEEALENNENIWSLPEEEWTEERVFYELPTDNWYINIFCQPYL